MNPSQNHAKRLKQSLALRSSALATAILMGSPLWAIPAQAQNSSQFLPYCQQTTSAIAQKDIARSKALKGDRNGAQQYGDLVLRQGQNLIQCRQQNWLKTQALWIRLYPCDTRPGAIEEVLDRIVDRGYNQINVEVFYNSQVLLPAANNPTAWKSVVNLPGQERADLLADVIQKAKMRGIKVYAWLFSLNFGADYVSRPDKRSTIAINGRGQTTMDTNFLQAGMSVELGVFNPKEAFIDPYNAQIRQDYAVLVAEVAKRRPDGILLDYIRYPKGRGPASWADDVQDLWIYGEAAQTALLQRAQNDKGRELIIRYLRQGKISSSDVLQVDRAFPLDASPPMWQGRVVSPTENQGSLTRRTQVLARDLWQLTVGHAMQGVVDFATSASTVATQAGIPSGAVFFPEGNQMSARGYDSRLQAWDRFGTNLEWHPMVYGVCGRSDCITSQVSRVLQRAPNRSLVQPVLAGIWQQSISNRPPLEIQMQAIRQQFPQVSSMSHFAYSWQEPESDRDRKLCRSRLF